ncbi:MAG: DUF2934 domain-containing protein [Spirochaetales bacterium]|nr:DUF2934 domain-containing protein [Spirochaetales bacterium]
MKAKQNQIAQRAYELFLARKNQSSDHLADWYQAEKEIVGTTTKKTAVKKTTKKVRS